MTADMYFNLAIAACIASALAGFVVGLFVGLAIGRWRPRTDELAARDVDDLVRMSRNQPAARVRALEPTRR